jgi:hypothetical protein
MKIKKEEYFVLDVGNDNYRVLRGRAQTKKLALGKTYTGDELEELGYELDREEGLEERIWIAKKIFASRI